MPTSDLERRILAGSAAGTGNPAGVRAEARQFLKPDEKQRDRLEEAVSLQQTRSYIDFNSHVIDKIELFPR